MRVIVISLYLSLSTGLCFSQYREIPLPFADTTRYTVQFVDEMHGWVIGSRGSILRTTDGGHTWVEHLFPTNSSLTTTRFVDPTHGWCWVQRCPSHGACLANELYRTGDGGETWIRTGFPDSAYVLGRVMRRWYPNVPFDIEFIDSATVLFSGEHVFTNPPGYFNQEALWYLTEDSGNTWKILNPLTLPYPFDGELFVRNRKDWLIFQYWKWDTDRPSKTGCILSSDSGITWRNVAKQFDGVVQNIWKEDSNHYLIFSSKPLLYGGYSGTYATTNGGEKWNTFPIPFDAVAKMGVMPKDTTLWVIELAYDPYDGIADAYAGYLYRTHPFFIPYSRPPHTLMYPEKVRWIDHVGTKVYALTSTGKLILFDDLALSVEISQEPPGSVTPSIISIAPNPCAATAQVIYETGSPGPLAFTIRNALGMKVRDVPAREQSAPGRYSFEIGMEGLAEGVYFLSLGSSRGTETKRFVKLR